MPENFILSDNNIIMSQGGNTFPITGQVENTAFTADATFSSFNLSNTYGFTTIADDYVKYSHAPSISISATWLDIIHAATVAPPDTPTTYCYVYPTGVTSLDLDTLSAYNKVTVLSPGDYSPDRMLYGTDDNLNHSQKVMPSGLWVEALKNRKEGGQYSWSLINSGWISFNNMWEGD